jgi:hypothetical protein
MWEPSKRRYPSMKLHVKPEDKNEMETAVPKNLISCLVLSKSAMNNEWVFLLSSARPSNALRSQSAVRWPSRFALVFDNLIRIITHLYTALVLICFLQVWDDDSWGVEILLAQVSLSSVRRSFPAPNCSLEPKMTCCNRAVLVSCANHHVQFKEASLLLNVPRKQE